MDFNKFTEKAQLAISEAQALAVKRNHQAIDLEHLLLALLQQENGLIPRLLTKADINVDKLQQRLEQMLAKIPVVTGSASTYITPRLNQLLIRAQEAAKRLKDEYLSVEHLVLAMFDDTQLANLFAELGLTKDISCRL